MRFVLCEDLVELRDIYCDYHMLYCLYSPTSAEAVHIMLLVLRLSDVGTDVLITLNMPSIKDATAATSADASTSDGADMEVADGGEGASKGTENGAEGAKKEDQPPRLTNVDVMRYLLNTFKILDWSLFA